MTFFFLNIHAEFYSGGKSPAYSFTSVLTAKATPIDTLQDINTTAMKLRKDKQNNAYFPPFQLFHCAIRGEKNEWQK